MKPIIVLPVGAMNDAEIAKLTDNGICVVVAKEPAAVRFVDSIPAVTSRTEIENAAIRFTRRVVNPGFWSNDETRQLMCKTYLDLLIDGSPLDAKPTQQERERTIFNNEKETELRKLAREEAKSERAAAKAAAKKS